MNWELQLLFVALGAFIVACVVGDIARLMS